MLIRVVRSGGFAGIRKQGAVETTDLSPERRAHVEGIVERAEFFTLPERHVSGLPDVVTYRVSIEAGPQSREISFDERTAPEELLELVRDVLNRKS